MLFYLFLVLIGFASIAQGIMARFKPRALLRVLLPVTALHWGKEWTASDRLMLRLGYRFGVPRDSPLNSRADYLSYWRSETAFESVESRFWWRHWFLFSIPIGCALIAFGIWSLL